MSNLPSQHPSLSLHLTDLSLTPLITSSQSPGHLEALTSLANSALTGRGAIQRMTLGDPQRVMVEYPDRGALILQSYMDPATATAAAKQKQQQQQEPSRPGSPEASRHSSRPETANGDHEGGGGGSGGSGRQTPRKEAETVRKPEVVTAPEDAPPMLVSVVVAGSADQAREARQAAAKLERVGREFQREWLEEVSSKPNDEPTS